MGLKMAVYSPVCLFMLQMTDAYGVDVLYPAGCGWVANSPSLCDTQNDGETSSVVLSGCVVPQQLRPVLSLPALLWLRFCTK